MDTFLIHNLGLLWFSLGTARLLVKSLADRMMAAALLIWGNLVFTSLLLSLVQQLGQPSWFLSTSLLLAGLIHLLTSGWRIAPPSPLPEKPVGKPPPLLLAAFIVTLIPLTLAGIVIAWTYPASNPDSLAWQIPRVFYYLGQGSLIHFDATDLRQTHLPFNHSLLQAMGLVYGAPLQCLNFINLAAWGLSGLAVYRLCRLKCSVNASFLVSWLALVTPPVVAQAIVATPELPAGAAMLGFLYFASLWHHTRQSRHALLAGLALGLATGSSLNVLLCGIVALLSIFISTRSIIKQVMRPWLVASLLAASVLLPFAVINFASDWAWIGSYCDYFFHQRSPNPIPDVWMGIWPLPSNPAPLSYLNEDGVGLGFSGLLFLIAAIGCLVPLRRPASLAGWLAWLGLGWFITNAIFIFAGYGTPRNFVPVLLLLTSCAATMIDFALTRRRLWQVAGLGFVLLGIVTALWSSGIYLLSNNHRPLTPLLNAAFAPPALPTLPLLLDHHLSRQTKVNIDTDALEEPILPFLLRSRGQQQLTSFHRIQTNAYNLLSRSTLSRNSSIADLDKNPSYLLLAVPNKRTAGVEFLNTIGNGTTARDYFGINMNAGQSPPIASNRSVLVTLYHLLDTGGVRIHVAGLNPEDHARLEIQRELNDGNVSLLATLSAQGKTTISIVPPFHQLRFLIKDEYSGIILGEGVLPYQPPASPQPPPIDSIRPSSSRSIFVTDLVLSPSNPGIIIESLLPVEGPFPQWDLPHLRWQRQPNTTVTILPIDGFARLQLSFSVRLNVRRKAALEVRFNDQTVGLYRIDDHTAWLDQTLDLTPLPGANKLEFVDAPLNNEPDWTDYLDRYPDVKKYVTTNGIPLEAGAKAHYEASGRSEGRTLHHILKPEPAPDGYYFMYRNIRLEGFKSP